MAKYSSAELIAPHISITSTEGTTVTDASDGHTRENTAQSLFKGNMSGMSGMELKESERHGTVLSGFTVITKSMIGSGIFGMARACSKFGIISGVIFLFLAACITWLSLRVLSTLALDFRNENPSFYSVSEKVLPKARWVLDLALVINCLGAAIVYVQTAGNLMAYAIISIFGMDATSSLQQSHIAMIVQAIMVTALAPLCMMKEISATKIPNMIGLTCLLYIVIVTFFYTPITSASTDLLYPGGALVALGSFPTFIFAFACQQNMFTVANELKDANMRRLDVVGFSSTFTGFVVYMPMMIIPFLSFGLAVESNYLYNMVIAEGMDLPIIIAFIAASVSVSISYVLQVQPVRRSLTSLVYGSVPLTGKKESTVRVGVVTAILLVSFALAVGLGQDLSLPINIAGLLGGNTMCFVMPFLLYLTKYGFSWRDKFSVTIMTLLVFCCALYPICLTGIIYDAVSSRS